MPPQTRKGAMVWKVKDKDEPVAEPAEKPEPSAPKQKGKPEKHATPVQEEAVEEPKKSGGGGGGGKGKGKSKKAKAEKEPVPEVVERVERPKEGRRKGNDESENNRSKNSKSGGKSYSEMKESGGKKSAKSKGKGKESGGGGGKGKGRAAASARASADDDDVMKKPMRRTDDSHKQHIEATGEHCSVKKHSSMGIAVVSMNSQADRNAVLAYAERERQNMERVRGNGKEWGPEVDIGGKKVELKRHTDKNTNQEIPTDMFAAWGHQDEKDNPLEAETIAEAFDALLLKAKEAETRFAVAKAIEAAPQAAAFTSTTPYVQQPYARNPPPPPGHYPNVGGQVQTQAAAYGQQVSPSQQQQSAPQPAFPDAYGYWLAQQQFAAQQQQQWMAHQQYQQQLAVAQQQAQQYQAAAPTELYSAVKPLPKPLKIVDPKEGTVVESLGQFFKPREESKPLKIINPASGESIPGLP